MRELKILGTGCAKCQKLGEHTETAAKALGIEYRVEKVTDLQEIMGYGVMMTPALVVDGQVRFSGKAPGVAELKGLL